MRYSAPENQSPIKQLNLQGAATRAAALRAVSAALIGVMPGRHTLNGFI
jgi:hypothetical protein